ncbi:ATP/GTP-binding protein [Streptomyces odontomachi]|uniref:ATP/GTP-binding protein n=1 Tax=Streptomyces odontomachi TaxID=2944940 RepID=UPI0027E23D8D|nr:ATP/GTP-binding protein [Streptomyces sp. ODS25]
MLITLGLALLLWVAWDNGDVPYEGWLLAFLTPNDWWWAPSLTPKTWKGFYARQAYDGLFPVIDIIVFGRLGGWLKVVRGYVETFSGTRRILLTVVGAVVAVVLAWNPPLSLVQTVFDLVYLAGGSGLFMSYQGAVVTYGLYTLIIVGVVFPFALIGKWWSAFRRPVAAVPPLPQHPAPVMRSEWPELRTEGRNDAADRLAGELRAGQMNEVDCARVLHHWEAARRDPQALAAFFGVVLREGAKAWLHPSGHRDLPQRTADHDALTGQVRIGHWATVDGNPEEYHAAGAALEEATLGTSLLVIGPPGSGKSVRVARPVVESLALGALAGRAGVIAVCAAGTPLGPDDAFDVVVRLGDPGSVHDLDLYAGTIDADEAADFLAEGLVGDVDGVDTRRAATVLAQVLGPYRSAYGRFPTVQELSDLLRAVPDVLVALRGVLEAAGNRAMLRELDIRERQAASPADLGLAIADRLALLDRPAFAEFFGAGQRADRLFTLNALAHHPLRVRIDLPEGGHKEASRLVARLLLAQFCWVAAARTDRSRFIGLVLDDAAQALTAGTVRAIQRLRSMNAGVVLALRTIADVPEALHGALHTAVGCRMALTGVTTWDGRCFAEAWGIRRVEVTEVAKHTVFADSPVTRALHTLRKMVTGRAVTTDAVTVRQVERAYWSASELANDLPPGHAVLSLTAVHGDQAPPMLVDLRG